MKAVIEDGSYGDRSDVEFVHRRGGRIGKGRAQLSFGSDRAVCWLLRTARLHCDFLDLVEVARCGSPVRLA